MTTNRAASSSLLGALSQHWMDEFPKREHPGNATQPLDLVTSALVLAAGEVYEPCARDVASILRPLKLLNAPMDVGDNAVLKLAFEVLVPGEFAVQGAFSTLAHPWSGVRLWMFKHAWILRHRLSPTAAAPYLLRNVANTLGYWEESLALCRAIYRSDERFWTKADAYEPREMPDQYAWRIAAAKEQPGWERAESLAGYEAQVRDFLARWHEG